MLPDLTTALLDLLYELRGTDIKLIIGGGFSIYLRYDRIRRTGERTLIGAMPESRATNDLDLFLRPELLVDSPKLQPLADALKSLGYKVIEKAEFYQFAKPGPGGTRAGSIKIDLLTGPESRFDGTRVKTDSRRAHPKPSVGLHAHPTNEAVTLEEGLQTCPVEGALATGVVWKDEIFLPHA